LSTHPFIPLYVDDFDAATAHLSVEEDGAYNRLLRLCWRTPGCSLPEDAAWIARKLRLSSDDFQRIAEPVLAEFFVVIRGRFVQRRLKREYDDISRKRLARKLAGKIGGEIKARNAKAKSPSNATILLPDTRAFPEPYPEPYSEKKEIELTLLSVEASDGLVNGHAVAFNVGWSAYPQVGRGRSSRQLAIKQWKAASKRAGSDERLIMAIQRYAASDEATRQGGQFVKGFHIWLRDGFWENWTADRPAPKRVGFV
jgi:uncharacterized protein YdaU (DUF1376 family)